VCVAQNPALSEMKDLIDHVVDMAAARSKSAALMRQQECFAVKAGIDGDLDAVRKVRHTQGVAEMDPLHRACSWGVERCTHSRADCGPGLRTPTRCTLTA
jgi:hypothetical protein